MKYDYIILDGMVVPTTEVTVSYSADTSTNYQQTNISFSKDSPTITITATIPTPTLSLFNQYISSKTVVSLVRIRFEDCRYIIRSAAIMKKITKDDQTIPGSSVELLLMNPDSVTDELLDR